MTTRETIGLGKWAQAGVPHRGWTCLTIEDLKEDGSDTTAICQMCERTEIRFVHVMVHADYPVALHCGCICAGHMEEDLVGARQREATFKRQARRRRTWLTRPWSLSRKGNEHIKQDGFHVVVFPTGAQWGWRLTHLASGEVTTMPAPRPSVEAAKLSAFKALYDNTQHEEGRRRHALAVLSQVLPALGDKTTNTVLLQEISPMPAIAPFSPYHDANGEALTTIPFEVAPGEEASCDGQDDFSLKSGNVEIVFRNHQTRLIANIRSTRAVIGCVAWLTDGPILEALARKELVSIVVQKEDFLRPDIDGTGQAEVLRAQYRALRGCERSELPGIVAGMSVCADPSVEAVRCVGIHNAAKRSAHPRMHHKFLVFCDLMDFRFWPEAEQHEWARVHYPDLDFTHALAQAFRTNHRPDPKLVPKRVWTGSYNLTQTGALSWENAVILDDPAIARAYALEHSQILALSEPLDWENPWVAPEWRIGT